MSKVSKKERKKQIPVKTSLNSPYDLQWSSLQQGDMQFILNTLKERIATIGLKKQEVKVFRAWGKNKKKLLPPEQDVPASDTLPMAVATEPRLPEKSTEQGWTDVTARKQLAIGINEVTKALERNELRLLLVCKSVKPAHMTDHLIPLSKSRGVPACQVPRLSENLAGQLGLKCVLALGFKRDTEMFSQTVDAIIPKVPSFQVAWIPEVARLDLREKQTGAAEADDQRGQKRKVEMVSPETGDSPKIRELRPLLQPLRVKKIIPNPSKTRKPKKKK